MQRNETVRRAIENANKNFVAAFNAGDAAGVAAAYTEDAQFKGPHMVTLEGRDAIRAFMAGAMEAGVAGLELTTLEVFADDETAVEHGRYRMTTADGGTADVGDYMVHWMAVDGAWRLHRDMISTDSPAPGGD